MKRRSGPNANLVCEHVMAPQPPGAICVRGKSHYIKDGGDQGGKVHSQVYYEACLGTMTPQHSRKVIGASFGQLPLAWSCRWHCKAAACLSAECIKCSCGCPICTCQKASCQHQADSSAAKGPATAGKRDGWGLSGQVPNSSLPGPPATSSKGAHANNHVTCLASLEQDCRRSH